MDAALPDPLTPWVGPRLAAAEGVFLTALAGWLGQDVSLRCWRRHTAGTKAPTFIAVTAPSGAQLELRLHTDPDLSGWRAGPLVFTVARPTSGHSPLSDATLRRVVEGLAARVRDTDPDTLLADGKALAAVHRTWAVLASMPDRMLRHIEQAHNGKTGLLRTGFTCNQDCYFCPEGRDWPNPSDDQIFAWLDEMVTEGVSRLTVCGGEPTVWSRLPELLERATAVHGLRVHMNSNAIRLRQPGFAARLKDAGLRSVMVSLHAVDPDLSDRMTRARGTHARTVAGIHAALDAGLTVILNCCVDQTNVTHLPEHARYVRDHFVLGHPDNPVRMVNYSQPGRYYDDHAYRTRLVAYDEALPYVTEAARTLGDVGVLLEIAGTCGFPSCVVRDVSALVPWRPRSSMDAGHRAARADDPEPCRVCAVRDQCIGPRREYLDVHGVKGLVPFDHVPTSDWYTRLAALPLGEDWEVPSEVEGVDLAD